MNLLWGALNYVPRVRVGVEQGAESNALPFNQLRWTVPGPWSQSPGRIL